MNSLLQLSLPAGFLMYCLNAAVASLVACAIAVVLSRRAAWSLPMRHAMLVAAFTACLTAPLFVPLFNLPSLWAINVEQLPPLAVSKPMETSQREEEPVLPVMTADPVTEVIAPHPTSVVPATVVPVSTVPERPPLAPVRERPSLTTGEWARVIGTLFCGVWIIGITVGMARAIVDLVKLQRLLQSVAVSDNELLAAAARRAADSLGLGGAIPIYHSNLLPAPVTFGLLRARIVVPAGLVTSLSPDQLRAVIQHEMAHIARRDLWIGLLQQSVAIVYWWNPLVLLVNRQLADLREQICDDIAIRGLPEPDAYASTLISLAERCSMKKPFPATLGIGASPAGQLERRIRRIVSSRQERCFRLTRRAIVGVSAAAVLMTASILLAQVQVKSSAQRKPDDQTEPAQPRLPTGKPEAVPIVAPSKAAVEQEPTLADLIQQMAAWERMYLPYDIKSMETFRYPEDLTPQERAKNLMADGRKHQRLMEYAQLGRRIWRTKETHLIDDEVQHGGPWQSFSDGEGIVQASPGPGIIDGKTTLDVYIQDKKRHISNYAPATPLCGIFCLSSSSAGELFSEAFKDAEGVDMAWDKGDAKLTFGYGKPHWNTRFVLWLSRAHDWHPIRLQRFWDAKDELFFDEWEVTQFVQHGKIWRVAEGTHRYRELKGRTVVDPRIKYSMDFKVLEEKYGNAVDEKQFKYEIPAGANIRDENKPEAEPPLPAKTREIAVTVVDLTGKPIPNASIRLPASLLRDLDVITTDEQGVARSAKASAGDVSVHITADGYRPVTWGMGNVSELRAIMVPLSPGVVVYEGKPAADVWITNESLQIRADGFTYVPQRDWDGRDKDWSNGDGRFELKTNLTLRRPDVSIPFVAVHPDREKMAIRFVPAQELGQRQELALQPVCHVSGHCLLQGMTESVEVSIGLESAGGQYIGFLSTRRALTPAGLRVDFELRLPPGEYMLRARQTSYHAGFTIPFSISTEKRELDLGTSTVPAAGAVALRGKPAPELDVQWRPGQDTNWEKLRGKVVVLDFWGMWCGPCVNDMPLLMDIADQFHDKPVEWLSVHTPNVKTFDELDRGITTCQETIWNKRALPFTTALDSPVTDNEYSGDTSQRYGVAEWPTLIVVDQQGKVVGPVTKKTLAETIARLLDSGIEK